MKIGQYQTRLTILLLVIIGVGMTACGTTLPLVGKWKHIPNEDNYMESFNYSNGEHYLEFLSDGHVNNGVKVMVDDNGKRYLEFLSDGQVNYGTDYDTYTGDYGIDGNQIIIAMGNIKLPTQSEAITLFAEYKIEGNILILIDEQKGTFKYRRIE